MQIHSDESSDNSKNDSNDPTSRKSVNFSETSHSIEKYKSALEVIKTEIGGKK